MPGGGFFEKRYAPTAVGATPAPNHAEAKCLLPAAGVGEGMLDDIAQEPARPVRSDELGIPQDSLELFADE